MGFSNLRNSLKIKDFVADKLQVYETASLTEFPGNETVIDPSNRPRALVYTLRLP
jgi:hypothetical protein